MKSLPQIKKEIADEFDDDRRASFAVRESTAYLIVSNHHCGNNYCVICPCDGLESAIDASRTKPVGGTTRQEYGGTSYAVEKAMIDNGGFKLGDFN
jgi:hypothetical protein